MLTVTHAHTDTYTQIHTHTHTTVPCQDFLQSVHKVRAKVDAYSYQALIQNFPSETSNTKFNNPIYNNVDFSLYSQFQLV